MRVHQCPRGPDSQRPPRSHPRPHRCSVTLYRFLEDDLLAGKRVVLLRVAGVVRRNKFQEALKRLLYLVRICRAEDRRGSMIC